MYYNAPEMWVARSARPVPSICGKATDGTRDRSLTNQ